MDRRTFLGAKAMATKRKNTEFRQQQIIEAAAKLIFKYGSEHVTVKRITNRFLAYVRSSSDPTGTAQSLFRLNRSSESGHILQCLTRSNRRGT
jgi:hypothetical protein